MAGTPAPFGASFAACLGLRKRDVVQPSAEAGQVSITQFGAAYLDTSIALPDPPQGQADGGPLIDMFVCGRDGGCEATGSDDARNASWRPTVQAMADAVLSALSRFDVPVASEAYVTTSFTPGIEVVGEAHVDDDQFLPDDGVGVVAILGSDVGPRVATTPIDAPAPRPGLPLAIPPATFDRFTAGELPHQQADAGRIVLFPQFGQLHAGPALASTSPELTRQLLVLRVATAPTGSTPAG